MKLWRRVNLWDGHDYFYDAEAVRVPYKPGSLSRYDSPMQGTNINSRQPGREFSPENAMRSPNPAGANLRNVWTIATESFSGAHFATFPQKLVEPCIRARHVGARGMRVVRGAVDAGDRTSAGGRIPPTGSTSIGAGKRTRVDRRAYRGDSRIRRAR